MNQFGTHPSEGFTCMDCLENEAVIWVDDGEGGEHHMCRKCIELATSDRLLDRVNEGIDSIEALKPEPKDSHESL